MTQYYTEARVYTVLIYWALGCIACCPLSADAFVLPSFTRNKMRKTTLGGTGVASCFSRLYRRFYDSIGGLLSHLRKRGNLVIFFDVDNEWEYEDVARTYNGEVDGLMTDYPTKLNDWIHQRSGKNKARRSSSMRDKASRKEEEPSGDLEMLILNEDGEMPIVVFK